MASRSTELGAMPRLEITPWESAEGVVVVLEPTTVGIELIQGLKVGCLSEVWESIEPLNSW